MSRYQMAAELVEQLDQYEYQQQQDDSQREQQTIRVLTVLYAHGFTEQVDFLAGELGVRNQWDKFLSSLLRRH